MAHAIIMARVCKQFSTHTTASPIIELVETADDSDNQRERYQYSGECDVCGFRYELTLLRVTEEAANEVPVDGVH